MNKQTENDLAPTLERTSLDDFLPYLLNRISNRLNTDLNEELKSLGVSLPYWRVLAVLHVHDGRTIGEMSVYTVIEQSTLSRIVDRMEKADLVVRRPNQQDARVVEVFMTDAGRAAFERIMPVAMRHYRRAVDGLSDEENRVLLSALHRVLENVRATPYP